MDKIRSLYLELLRIASACYVFLFHVGSAELNNQPYIATEKFNSAWGLKYLSAHYFVIIFFVLSGYLITMSACKNGITMKDFLIARLGRLYSVLLPALVFSYVIAFFLIQGRLVPQGSISNMSNLFSRFVLNVTFLTQSWSLCSTPPLNTPFWSVNYEFMYYLIISSLLLFKGKKMKSISFFLVLVIAGPKVIILLPAWLAGSLLYLYGTKTGLPKALSFALFTITTLLILFIIALPQHMPFTKDISDNKLFGQDLFFSWNYLSDYIFAIIVTLNIHSLFGISSFILRKMDGKILQKIYTLVKTTGNCTYTLYLFHLPLLFLFASVLPYDKANHFHIVCIIVLVLLSVYFIAMYTEWKVQFWRSLVAKTFQKINAIVKAAFTVVNGKTIQ